MNQYIKKMQDILSSFLGEPKRDIDENGQLEYGCPRCIEEKGTNEMSKHNLSVNVYKSIFQCWSCGQFYDDMHGSIFKLIKLYGNNEILQSYKDVIIEFKKSKLYELKFSDSDFNIDFGGIEKEELILPKNYRKFKEGGNNDKKALDYLFKRNIGWDIINKYSLGYTLFDKENLQVSSRIIIPSFNKYEELNYWTGRDYTYLPKRQKYFNPNVERKEIIFNEEKICWDADITLVEGPFDHIVVPNSIPLLGKIIKPNFKIFQDVVTKANANVNIFLDGDAVNDVIKLYTILNHDRLYNKIRYIPCQSELDPSKIYELYGNKGITAYLKNASKIKEYLL